MEYKTVFLGLRFTIPLVAVVEKDFMVLKHRGPLEQDGQTPPIVAMEDII
jgi:hypothetical protein